MRVRPIAHDDRLSIIDHLDELRGRVFVCVGVLFVAFCVCFWQNHHLINALNRALPPSAKTGLGDQSHQDATLHNAFEQIKRSSKDLQQSAQSMQQAAAAKGGNTSLAASAAQLTTAASDLGKGADQAIKALPKNSPDREKPIVLGVSESFTVTIMVVAYFALMLTIPVLLYQLYAFVIPALSRNELRIALPVMIGAPLLFLAGVVFTYFAILPPAEHFLQGYNSDQFQVIVQASSYYKFEVYMLLGVGLAFEVPLLLLALQKVGIITARTLTLNWRYAVVIIALIAAALPGVDPVTMAVETAPLVALYLLSILLLYGVEYRARRRTRTLSQ
jgi:sec-independent protein translocase protein TatC